MPNTSALLEGWFDEGVRCGYAYMAIVQDVLDNYNEYAAFFWDRATCQEDIDDFDVNYTCEDERLMEVYDLSAPKEPQLRELRHFALQPRSRTDG